MKIKARAAAGACVPARPPRACGASQPHRPAQLPHGRACAWQRRHAPSASLGGPALSGLVLVCAQASASVSAGARCPCPFPVAAPAPCSASRVSGRSVPAEAAACRLREVLTCSRQVAGVSKRPQARSRALTSVSRDASPAYRSPPALPACAPPAGTQPGVRGSGNVAHSAKVSS